MIIKTSRHHEPIDMGAMIAANPNAVASGNAKMNARGDIVGRNGKIIKRREEVANEYYASPKAVKQVALRDISKEVFVSPEQAVADAKRKIEVQQARKRKIEDND